MGLNRTEIDPVTGGTLYYIDAGQTGKFRTLKMTGNDKKDNRSILKTIGRVGGMRWTDTYKKRGTEYVQIWGDRDVADIECFEFDRDSIVFTSKSIYDSAQAYPSVAGSGTFLASGNNIVVNLSDIGLNDFVARASVYYE